MHPLQNVQLKSVAHMQFSKRTYIAFLAIQFDLAGDRSDHFRGANVPHHGDWHSGHNGQGEEMSPPAGSCDMRAPIFLGRVPGWADEQITAIVTGRLPIHSRKMRIHGKSITAEFLSTLIFVFALH